MPSSAAPQNTNNGLPVDLECSEEEEEDEDEDEDYDDEEEEEEEDRWSLILVISKRFVQHGRRWWWWLFPRVRGFWENVRPFIPRLRSFFFLFFFLEVRLGHAH